MESLSHFVQELVDQIAPIEYQSNIDWWRQATTGSEEATLQMHESQLALAKLFSSREKYQKLLSFPETSDTSLLRQVKLLKDAFIEHQIPEDLLEEIVQLEVQIETDYTNFRPSLLGKEVSNNELKEVFFTSNSSLERKEAWEASKKIGEVVEKKILRLVELRNRAASLVGYSDFYTMRLELQEIDQKRLFEILDELEQLSDPIFHAYKAQLDLQLAMRFGIEEKDLAPWHYQDPFFQEAPHTGINFNSYYKGKDIVAISRNYYATLNLSVDDILERSDLFERENKSQHAFCMTMDRGSDVRILCNVRDDEYWMGTQLHELGHAVYDKYIDQSLPYLLRHYAHISTTEAIAMLFGRLSCDAHFLRTFCGAQEALDGADQIRAKLLVFARWVLVMTHFERALYQRPSIELSTFWWECVEKYQGIRCPQGRHKPDFASKLHLACAPVYYQNYLLGEMTASQLLRHLGEKPGEYLKERLFSLGAKHPWEETLFLATGERLNLAYFIEDLKN